MLLVFRLLAHHVFAVALQEVTDGFHADADGTGGLVLFGAEAEDYARSGNSSQEIPLAEMGMYLKERFHS
jgi:hypothetical protein